MVNRLGFNFLSRFFFLALSFLKYVVSSCYRRLKTWTYIVCCVTNCKYPHVIRTSSPVTTSHLAYEQAPSEGGKKFGKRSVNLQAKRVGVGAWMREGSEWDRSRVVQLALDYTQLACPKPNRSLFAGYVNTIHQTCHRVVKLWNRGRQ